MKSNTFTLSLTIFNPDLWHKLHICKILEIYLLEHKEYNIFQDKEERRILLNGCTFSLKCLPDSPLFIFSHTMKNSGIVVWCKEKDVVFSIPSPTKKAKE